MDHQLLLGPGTGKMQSRSTHTHAHTNRTWKNHHLLPHLFSLSVEFSSLLFIPAASLLALGWFPLATARCSFGRLRIFCTRYTLWTPVTVRGAESVREIDQLAILTGGGATETHRDPPSLSQGGVRPARLLLPPQLDRHSLHRLSGSIRELLRLKICGLPIPRHVCTDTPPLIYRLS